LHFEFASSIAWETTGEFKIGAHRSHCGRDGFSSWSRSDRVILARRFNAGTTAATTSVASATVEIAELFQPSLTRLKSLSNRFPALKRRAKFNGR
jgi:hypothetical protein